MADQTRAKSSRLSRRTALTVASLVVLMVGGAVVVWRNIREPAYVGTSRRVTLSWVCGNGIYWPRNGDRPWWAGHSPVANGVIETSVRTGKSELTRVATGTLTFVSRSEATFRSDAGGTLAMKRRNPNTVEAANCVGGSLPGDPLYAVDARTTSAS